MNTLRYKIATLGSVLAGSLLLAGCPSESDTTPAGREPDTGSSLDEATMKFSPFTGEFPLPINLLFDLNPDTTDFTLNIPGDSPPVVAGNQLDGWSTIAPFTAAATEALDATTVMTPGAVRVFRVCGDPFRFGAPTGTALGELVPGEDFTVGLSAADSATIIVKPLKPLADKYDDTSLAACPDGTRGNLNKGNTYIVAVTNTVKAADGGDVGTSSVYELSTNPLCFYKFSGDSSTDCPGTDGNTPDGITQAGIDAGLDTASVSSLESTENVRRLVNGQEALAIGISTAAAAGGSPLPALDGDSIVLTYSFSPVAIDNPDTLLVPGRGEGLTKLLDTWDIVKGLAAAAGAGQTLILNETGQSVPGGSGRVLVGKLTVPYYLTAPSQANPTAPLTETWKANMGTSPNGNSTNLTFLNPQPVKTADVEIPVLAVLPELAAPTDNLPIAILQHGITTNRVSVAAIAEALSRAGIASVAIDLPLHGIPPGDAFAFLRSDDAALAPLGLPGERTFDVDYLDANGAAGPDGTADPSGSHFINLANLVVSRDNLRQAVSDLLTLEGALSGLTAINPQTQNTTAGFDSDRVFFFGHSLGAIVGTTFLAQTDNIDAATLAKGGGGIAKLLDASAGFGPRITAGLAAAGVSEGTSSFESFLYFAQAAVDVGDPLNHAPNVTAPVHVLEVTGGGMATSTGPSVVTITVPSDLVVPNDASDPQAGIEIIPETGLGGTDPLNTALGLDNAIEQRETDNCNFRVATAPVAVQFDTGTHGTVATGLDTLPSPGGDLDFNFLAEHQEMLNQIASFFGGVAMGGAGVIPIDQTCGAT